MADIIIHDITIDEFAEFDHDGIGYLIGTGRVDVADEQPTVDAEPVRHGRWIESDSPGDCCYRCSECGFIRDAYLLDIGNYCPKCGAKMDGERE